jgi:hypothetical protein
VAEVVAELSLAKVEVVAEVEVEGAVQETQVQQEMLVSAGNPGSAATPSTVNCVPVTPGTNAPIVVGSPGGQIVISWNPQ